jgi:hypothetical protein
MSQTPRPGTAPVHPPAPISLLLRNRRTCSIPFTQHPEPDPGRAQQRTKASGAIRGRHRQEPPRSPASSSPSPAPITSCVNSMNSRHHPTAEQPKPATGTSPHSGRARICACDGTAALDDLTEQPGSPHHGHGAAHRAGRRMGACDTTRHHTNWGTPTHRPRTCFGRIRSPQHRQSLHQDTRVTFLGNAGLPIDKPGPHGCGDAPNPRGDLQ